MSEADGFPLGSDFRDRDRHGHHHQQVDEWAERGLADATDQQSPERDASAAAIDSLSGQPLSGADATVDGDPLPTVLAEPQADTQPPSALPEGLTPAPSQLDGPDGEQLPPGAPGNSSSPGERAEQAAFTGDGAYSEGDFGSR